MKSSIQFFLILIISVLISLGCDNQIMGTIGDDTDSRDSTAPEFRIIVSVSGSPLELSSGDTLILPDTFTETIRTLSLELWNDGDDLLHLMSSNLIDLSSVEDFKFVAPYPSSPINPGSSEVIYINFSPITTGLKSVEVSIPNNDSDESNFQLTVEADVLINPSPGTPLNIIANDGISTNTISVQWDGILGADLYVVYREESDIPPIDENDFLDTLSGSNYSDETAVPGRKYYYWIRAWSGDTGFGPLSDYDTGYKKLSSPKLILYTGASDSISTTTTDIDWDDTTGDVSQYYIYRNTIPQLTGATELTSNVSNYSDTGGNPGQLYFYAVKAYSAGTASFSDLSIWEEGSRKLLPPTLNSAGNGIETDFVELGWTAPTGNVTAYLVTKREAAGTGFGEGFDTVGTAYQDTSAFPGRMLYYTVQAYSSDTDNYSDESNQISGYRSMVAAPWYFEASQGERATGVSDGPFSYDSAIFSRIDISWWNNYNDPLGTLYEDYADSYRVYRATSLNGTYSLISSDIDAAGLTVLNFYDYPPDDGITYYYKVQTYSSSSSSYSSLTDSTIASGFAILDGVENLIAENHISGGVLLSYDTVTDAERYYIYRTTSPTFFSEWDVIGYSTSGTYHDLAAPWKQTNWYHVRTWSSDPLHYGYLEEGSAVSIYND